MRRCSTLLILLTALLQTVVMANPIGSNNTSLTTGEVAWLFDIKMDKEGTPRGKVFLVVDGRKVLLRSAVIGEYSVVDRAGYKDKGVPSSALTACSGWWAGSGETLFVVRSKKRLVVYVRYLNEGSSNSANVRLKTIEL